MFLIFYRVLAVTKLPCPLFYSCISQNMLVMILCLYFSFIVKIITLHYLKPVLHLLLFAENRQERIVNMVHVNVLMCVLSIRRYSLVLSEKRDILTPRKRSREQCFTIFEILLAKRRKCESMIVPVSASHQYSQ